jgi:hypothetical protein
MIAPSLDCSRATVCPHGSVRASCNRVKGLGGDDSDSGMTVRKTDLPQSTRQRELS